MSIFLLFRSSRLRQKFEAAGKAAEFELLKNFLTAEKNAIGYPETAKAMGTNEGAVRVAIHRLRRRFREVFKEEIAQTVSTPQEMGEEIRYLMSVLVE